jgi:hypothetical protein
LADAFDLFFFLIGLVLACHLFGWGSPGFI